MSATGLFSIASCSSTSTSTSPTSPQSAISIRSLGLPHGILAPDVFGNAKSQPVLLSLSLHLSHSTAFSSADTLDDATIHYGHLAKAIRAASAADQGLDDLEAAVADVIARMGTKASGRFAVAQSSVEFCLPKASMSGDGLTLIASTTYDGEGRITGSDRVFVLQSVKVMTLIGVNSYERGQKQPLVTSLMLHLKPSLRTPGSKQTVALFGLEQLLVQIIQDTSYETLETLSDYVISQMRQRMLDASLPGSWVQLRIEKPRAIAFADAPAVEIVRYVPFSKQAPAPRTPQEPGQDSSRRARRASKGGEVAVPMRRLDIVKPYSGR